MLKKIRSRGILYTLGGKFNQIVPAWLFRFRIFRVYRLRALETELSPADAPALEYRWCETDDDLALAQRLTFFYSDNEDAEQRFQPCLAIQDDKIVGGVWQGTKYFDEDELGVRILLQENHAWIFAAFVAKTHRGQRIYPRLLNHVLAEDRHLVHYASINTTNRASIAAHHHFVESQSGRCVVIRLLSITFCWAGPGLNVSNAFTRNAKRQPIEIQIDQ